MVASKVLYSELNRSQRDYLTSMYLKYPFTSDGMSTKDLEVMASEFSNFVGRAFSRDDISGLLLYMRKKKSLLENFKGKKLPMPPSRNAIRAEKLTGIRPTNGTGWEKLAVILMNKLDEATE
jgi:hypothetical protein